MQYCLLAQLNYYCMSLDNFGFSMVMRIDSTNGII